MNAKKRINIIDLLVVLVVCIAAVVIGASKFIDKSAENANMKNMIITFYAEEVSNSIADGMKNGDKVSDKKTDVVFGNCTIEKGESVSYITNENKEFVKASRNGYSSVTIKCETVAQYTDIGIVYDDNIYGVGHTLTLLVGDTRFTARVKNIEIVEG